MTVLDVELAPGADRPMWSAARLKRWTSATLAATVRRARSRLVVPVLGESGPSVDGPERK